METPYIYSHIVYVQRRSNAASKMLLDVVILLLPKSNGIADLLAKAAAESPTLDLYGGSFVFAFCYVCLITPPFLVLGL